MEAYDHEALDQAALDIVETDRETTAAVMEMARVMSKYQFDATLVFMAVPGEEQGLLGSTHWAEEAKKKNLNIAAMFTNDIVGNTIGGNGVRDNARVRVFSEGVSSNETEAEARARQSVGGENDSASRQLARYIKEIGERFLGKYTLATTSGTTGTPGIFVLDDRAMAVTKAMVLRMLRAWLGFGGLIEFLGGGSRTAVTIGPGSHSMT